VFSILIYYFSVAMQVAKIFLNTCPISECLDLNIMFFISVAFPTEVVSIMNISYRETE